MKNYIDADKWEPIDNVYYSPDSVENEVIRGNKNYLVIAGPGAGKTELLAQKATFLLQTNTCKNPKKILAISFKVDAAENLKNRVETRCGKEASNRFVSKTYDAFFKNILDQYIYLLPEDYRPDEDYNILPLKDADGIDKYLHKHVQNFKYLDKNEKNFYRKIYLTQNQLPVPESDYGAELKSLWTLMLKKNGELGAEINFKMIGRLVQLMIKKNPIIKKILNLSFDYVFLDEFQDTTNIQYDVIKDLFMNTDTKVIAVGDNKQSIMKWAGANEKIFNIFKSDFKAVEKRLLINHRSAQNILTLEGLVATKLEGEEIEFKVDEKWGNNTGLVEMKCFENDNEEAEMILEKIKSLINEGIKPKDISILIRALSEKYCFKILKLLRENDINVRYEDKYQSLLREKVIQLILDILKVSLDPPKNTEFNRICSFLKNHKDLEEIGALLNNIKNKIKSISNMDALREIINEIICFIGVDYIKSNYPQYKRGEYLENIIEKFIELLFHDYEDTDSWKNAVYNFIGENKISIMSIHKSKGLEFNTVFFIGIDQEIFFNYSKEPREEMCAFFVGISRAKENLYITSTKNRENFIYGKQTTYVKDFYDIINQVESQ